jgi:hypothetical protein
MINVDKLLKLLKRLEKATRDGRGCLLYKCTPSLFVLISCHPLLLVGGSPAGVMVGLYRITATTYLVCINQRSETFKE